MKNILGNTENLELFNKDGKRVYSFTKNSASFSWEYTYDQNGKILTHKDSDGYSFETTYDQNGNRLTFKDSNGYSFETTYDLNSKILTYKDSNGYSYESTYDLNGKILTYKDSNGVRKGFNIPEYTMEELVENLGNFKIKK